MKYHIVTFGCAANEADSERIAALYEARGYTKARSIKSADDIVINTCMVRQKAEDRVYGIVYNLAQEKYTAKKEWVLGGGAEGRGGKEEKKMTCCFLLKKKKPQPLMNFFPARKLVLPTPPSEPIQLMRGCR